MNTAPKIYDSKNTESGTDFQIPDSFNLEYLSDSDTSVRTKAKNTDFEYGEPIQTPQLAPQFLKPLVGRFKLLQLWEGRITEITENTFSARISDKTNPKLPDEIVTLDIEEISPSDLSLVKLGSVFYWSIRYADFPGRGRSKESKIRFRRLPNWTKKEVEKAIKTGTELASFFNRD